MRSRFNTLLILSALSLSLVGCNNKFLGAGESDFFAVEKSSIANGVLDGEGDHQDHHPGDDVGREPSGEEPNSEDPAVTDGGAGGGQSEPVSTSGGSNGSASEGSTSSGSSSAGSSSAGSSSGSSASSGGSSGGSSGSCESAKSAQACEDQNCEPIFEEGEEPKFSSCGPKSERPNPPVIVSKCGCNANPAPKKVLVCHQTGNGGYHTINISCNALNAHLDHHNDSCGACPAGL